MPWPRRGSTLLVADFARAEGQPQPAPQQAAAYPLHQPRKLARLSAPADGVLSLQNCNEWQDKFLGDRLVTKQR